MEQKMANLLDKYDDYRQSTPGMIINTGLSVIPGIGPAVSLVDALHDYSRGRIGQGTANLGMAALNTVPLGGLAAKGVGKMIGRTIAPVGYIRDAGQIAGMAGKAMTGVGMQLKGQEYDTNKLMQSPEYQKQISEHENMLNDFQDWQKHRNYLQAHAIMHGNVEPTTGSPAVKLGSILKAAGYSRNKRN